ncbi:ABC transporter substrate-binding protein [Mucilaginibacter lappiensis]|uniref:ABC transporter substrate-binding protein n=1 Tax=Mucilaginibacter lappiensis TaxID=354630 RepID=UPI003D1B49A4
MKFLKYIPAVFLLISIVSCKPKPKSTAVPVVGFVDAFEDATIAQARTGFTDALKKEGFSEDKKTVQIEYRNAQGNIPTLTQIVNYFISENVDLLATSTTLATVTALQNTKTIPVFAMVSPVPERMKVVDAGGKAPANLFGALEDLNYIDTSFSIIPKLLKPKGAKLVIGMIYNQSEPQSTDALSRIKSLAEKQNVTIVALPVNTSADAQLVTQSLLSKNIDAFFANPDNTVFASFETILKSCNEKNVPIFTSEAGLVQRGAVAAFGADIYQWGYQAGEQAAYFLKNHKTDGLTPQMVRIRKRVYNPAAAKKYKITIPSNFEAVK